MSSRRVVAFVCAAVLVLIGVRAGLAHPTPQDDKGALSQADARILAEIHDHSEAMENLEHLSDAIGPRLTGTPQLKAANDWTAEMFKKYGLTNVHLESWNIAHNWIRGTATAKIVSPSEHTLTIAAAGWSPNTSGVVRGPVVYFDAQKREDFDKFKGKLKGAVVILSEPQSLSPPAPDNSFDEIMRPMQAPPRRPNDPPPPPNPFGPQAAAGRARNEFFKNEGVGLVLRDSGKPHGLLNMTGVGGERFDIGPVPTAFITGEGYRMIFRMLKHGPVQLEYELKSTIGEAPMDVYNTVAEIKGTEKPDEVVMLGAHLDSWDLGEGSTDNGTGSMAVLEAARTLAKLDLKPKRTIRFVLFSGEEEGLVGSRRYVEAHKADLDKVSGILVHDTGTGRVLALGLHDNYQDREIVDQVMSPEPLRELKLLEPTVLRQFGTDHASFDDVGVPGFWVVQDSAEYPKTHHSQTDTFDKVWKDELNQGAQVLAAWAFNTAQLPAMLPRRPAPPPRRGPQADAEAARTEAAPPPPPDPINEMDTKILAQVKSDLPELKSNLTYLADHIGPRLTGTPQQIRASHWTAEKFKEIGLDNAHLEPWMMDTGWTRGTATGKLLLPPDGNSKTGSEQMLTLATAGWSQATKGSVRGKVVQLNVETEDDLAQYKGKLGGAIVAVGRPVEMMEPRNPMLTPYAEGALPLNTPKTRRPYDRASYFKLLMAEMKFFADEKIAAVLYSSEKDYGLLNMLPAGRNYQHSPFPAAIMTRENQELITRLLEKGSLEAELNIQGSFSVKPMETYNTVAEIKGAEKPDEVVIVGGHLDSWDLGTGATDNGTGSMAVLEAARALKKLDVEPKRTIRFVLFTGEEQGLNGSRAYVKAHKDELAKISGVLIHDTGAGKVLTIGLMGNYGVNETIDHLLFPLGRAREVALMEPSLRTEGGSDHVPFDEAGVPAFWCIQDPADYSKTHHSQADTLDRVRWDDLAQGAQVLAVFAYNVAQAPEMLERKPAKSDAAK